jgi:putative transposase
MNYRREYIENSKIFITMVTSKRRPILIENINILRESFKQIKDKIKFQIEAIVILPDHIHMIIEPIETNRYPKIIKGIKTYFSRYIDETKIEDYELTQSRKDKREKDIWQRRYWEHSITHEEDLKKHIDYIHYNPIKHGYVKQAKEWEYSTFKKYVQQGLYDENWCDFTDDMKETIYE